MQLQTSNVIESDIKEVCCSCGRECSEGFVERGTGQREAGTGYQDIEIVCSQCNADEFDLCGNCFREDATTSLGEQRLCDGCYDAALEPEDHSCEEWEEE